MLVDGPGHQFLAGPGLAAHQHGGVGGGGPADGLVEFLHGRALADDGLGRGLGVHAHGHAAAHGAPGGHGLVDEFQYFRDVEGL